MLKLVNIYYLSCLLLSLFHEAWLILFMIPSSENYSRICTMRKGYTRTQSICRFINHDHMVQSFAVLFALGIAFVTSLSRYLNLYQYLILLQSFPSDQIEHIFGKKILKNNIISSHKCHASHLVPIQYLVSGTGTHCAVVIVEQISN